jgi:tRNA(fMet)-specific endonuclease VapC
MLYLLDTDHLTLLERGTAEGFLIKQRLSAFSPDDYGISIVTYLEQTKGWMAQAANAKTPDQEVRAFQFLHQNLRVCTSFAIWEYTPIAAHLCEQFREQKIRVGTQDLRIAAIALANNATLLTRNTRHFARIPSLLFEDWTVTA